MRQHVLILGAGFAGLELATRLSETLGDAVDVTLLDRNDSFYFGFSKLEVMLGRESSDAVRLPYGDIAKDGVQFRQETVTGIDPVARQVATDAGTYNADFLVVAMGADYDMAATPASRRAATSTTPSPGRSACATRWPTSAVGASSSRFSGSRSSVHRRRSRARSSCTSTSLDRESTTQCKWRPRTRCSARFR